MNRAVIILLLYLTSLIVGGSIGLLLGLLFSFTTSHGIPALVVLGSLSVVVTIIVATVVLGKRD